MNSAEKRFGAYVIQEEIARGGQGAVYRARHEASGRAVALKLLLDNHPKRKKRFAQEAKVLERLEHPNLLTVIESGDHGGMTFMAMELVEGTNLRDITREQGIPTPEWTCGVLSAVASALEHCHDQGLVHRDLKPENVMIEEGTERPVLVDFGLVKRDPEQMRLSSLDGGYSLLTKTGEMRGTPAFMAPEQAGSKAFGEVTPQTDVYGLGGILFSLLTGETPFKAESLISLMAQVMGDPAPDPRTINPQAPAHLAELCVAALAKNPAERPESAAAFRLGLRAPAPSVRGAPWALVGVLALAAVASLIFALALGSREAPAAFSWDDAVLRLRAGASLSPEQLSAIAAEPLAAHARAASAILEGATPESVATTLPEGPQRELLVASALLGAQAPDLKAIAERLEGAAEARLPWLPAGPADRWARLAQRLELRGESLPAARACLRVAAALGSAHPEALSWVDRAFELDAREASVFDVRFADWMLAWCEQTLDAAQGRAEEVPVLKLVRRRLFQYRLVDPEAQIPRKVLDHVLRLGSGPTRPVRTAILPGNERWGARWSRLVTLLHTRLSAGELSREGMLSNTQIPQIRSPEWREWIQRAEQQNLVTIGAIYEEYLLFRPEFAALWSRLAHVRGTRLGVWHVAYRLREGGAAHERVSKQWVQAQVAHTLLRLGRYAEAVKAFEAAHAIDDDVRVDTIGWSTRWHAEALAGAGRHEEALARLDRLRDVWARMPGYWRDRASYLELLGREQEAGEARARNERLIRLRDGR